MLGLIFLVEKDLLSQVQTEPVKEGIATVFKLAPLDDKQEPPVVTAMALSPDRKTLAVAGDDHAIRIVDLVTCQAIHTLHGHTDWVRSLAYSKDGRFLASCGNDCQLRVWTISSLTSHLLTTGEHAWITVTFHPDNDRLFVAGFGPKVEGWSVSTKSKVFSQASECRDHRAITVSNDGQSLAWGGRDGRITIYSLAEQTRVMEKKLHEDRVRSLQFSIDGSILHSIGEDRKIVRYDLPTERVVEEIKLPGGKLLSMLLLDSSQVALGGSDNMIHFYDWSEKNEVGILDGHRGSVTILCSDEEQLISSGYDTTIRLWKFADIWDYFEATPKKAPTLSNNNSEGVQRR